MIKKLINLFFAALSISCYVGTIVFLVQGMYAPATFYLLSGWLSEKQVDKT